MCLIYIAIFPLFFFSEKDFKERKAAVLPISEVDWKGVLVNGVILVLERVELFFTKTKRPFYKSAITYWSDRFGLSQVCDIACPSWMLDPEVGESWLHKECYSNSIPEPKAPKRFCTTTMLIGTAYGGYFHLLLAVQYVSLVQTHQLSASN